MPKERRQKAPPDGGYGWVIVACCALALPLATGLFRSAGVVYMALTDIHPNASKTVLALASTVSRAITPCVGLFAGKLADLYSFKAVVAIGGIVLFASLMMSAFVVFSVEGMFVTLGILVGIGSGMIMVPCTIITGLYFTKKRSMAMGIQMAVGGSITFAWPILFQLFIDEYTLSGTLMVWAAMSLHICALAMLLRQPTWPRGPGPPAKTDKKRHQPGDVAKSPKEDIELLKVDASKGDTTADIENGENDARNVNRDISNNDHSSSLNFGPSGASNQIVQQKVSSAHQNPPKKTLGSVCRNVGSGLKRDFSLFKNYVFVFILIGRMGYFFGTSSVIVILPTYAMEVTNGSITKQQAAFLLSVTSIGDIVARWMFGFLLDHLPVAKRTVFAFTLCCMGINVIMFQFATHYMEQLICAGFYGIFSGGTFVISFAITFDMMGPNGPGAHALQQLICAIPLLLSGPIVGVIREATGSFIHAWSCAGIPAIVGGLIWCLEPLFRRKVNDSGSSVAVGF